MLSNSSDICFFFLRINRRHALAKRQAVSRSLTVLLLGSLLVSLGFQAGIVQAQSFTWTGAGADNNWSTAGNWQDGTSPTGSDTTELRFTDASLRGSVFQDIANPFVLRQLEIETVNGGFTMDGGRVDFRSDSGSSGIYWGGPQPIVVNQDWQVNSALTAGFALTNGVGYGLLIHNGQIGGSGEFSVQNNMIVNGTVSGLSMLNVSFGGDLQVNGTIDSSVGSLSLGNFFGFNLDLTHLRGSGMVNTDIQLSWGENVISTDTTLTVNGRIFTAGGGDDEYTGSAQGLRIATGNVVVNDSVKNINLAIDQGASLSGSGTLTFRRVDRATINGEVAINKIVLDQTFTDGRVRLLGAGTINSDIDLYGGWIEGDLTLNGNIQVSDGFVAADRVLGGFGILTVNGDVVIDASNSSVGGVGEIRGNGRLIVQGNARTIYGGRINGVTNIVRGQLLANNATFSDTSSIFLEGGLLDVYPDSIFEGEITSIGSSQIQNIVLANHSFDGNIIVEEGTLNISGIIQGDGALTIKSGAAVTLQNSSSSVRLDVVNEGLIDGTSAKATIDSNLTSRGGEYQGLFDVTGTMTVASGLQSLIRSGADGYVEGGTFVNNSALSIQAGAVLRGPGALIVNGGQLSVNGEVRSNTVVDVNSIVLGAGLFVGDLSVNGRLGPGNSAGTIGVEGSLTLGETSVVTIEIGGSTPGLYDAIDGRGLSVLNIQGGKLDLVFLDNFTPDSLSDFDIFQNFAEINGRFGGSGGNNNFNAGDRYYFNKGSFAIEYGSSFIRLSDFQAVPEPSVTLLLGSLAMATVLRRRRRYIAA
jgi:hypothetical protein